MTNLGVITVSFGSVTASIQSPKYKLISVTNLYRSIYSISGTCNVKIQLPLDEMMQGKWTKPQNQERIKISLYPTLAFQIDFKVIGHYINETDVGSQRIPWQLAAPINVNSNILANLDVIFKHSQFGSMQRTRNMWTLSGFTINYSAEEFTTNLNVLPNLFPIQKTRREFPGEDKKININFALDIKD